jgi:hypothetical protein
MSLVMESSTDFCKIITSEISTAMVGSSVKVLELADSSYKQVQLRGFMYA